ncbi:MAG TPA: transferrin receptor-like dimerization domain-containing protein [Thermoanaerobaculia bacterium]|jgi:N-acetylated-alpha-linked acidic dipeptidase
MRRILTLILALTATLAFAQPSNPPLLGFSAASAEKERAVEQQFDAQLHRDNLREWMKRLSARPHHVGSPYDKDNAEFIESLLKSWGYDTHIEEFYVLFPTPKTRLVELTSPEHFTAKLFEPPVPGDATSGQTSEQLPVYNAYSIDGDVTGDLVYANYGIPADYELLARNGIDVRGKIVITRYGGSWRGIKPKVAAEHGAVGCLIYSDPRDDGYFQGDVYPKGAYRNENGAQRGSVADMPVYAGDPLTPGVGATKDAKRLALKDAATLTKIPVLPISYGDALPLLRAMSGPVAPPDWRGALPITYHLAGEARVHLKVAFNWDIKPLYDVIARMPGTDRADEWIMRGNHQDAWVNGASDPISGQVAMLEEARAIAELAKSGWRPRRTLVYAAWDGEEPGLLGSTEWVETHADQVRDHIAVYINSDSSGRGYLDAGGSHTLEKLMTQVARDVVDPERKVSVLQRNRDRALAASTLPERTKEIRDRELMRLDALGSGSDYTPFLQHIGVASMNIGYGGESGGGSYHSVYDSFDHYIRFGDPTFDYGIAQAQTTGRLVLRLADADVLPLEVTSLASTISTYADEVMKLADSERAKIDEKDRELREHTMEIASDPTKPFYPPKAEDPAPHLEFAPLENSVTLLQRAAKDFDAAAVKATPEQQAALDRALMHLEQSLTLDQGLPRRPWYRHFVYAPGFYTGYGVKTLPGVREAIEQHQWKEANDQIIVLAKVLETYASAVRAATPR